MKSGKKKREALEVYLQNETIKWKGEPKPKFSITFLELGGHYDAMSGPTSIFGLVLGMTIVASMVFYNQSNWLAVILTILIGISILIIPEYLKNQRKKNTKYALTENKVFFQLWRWGKISIHSIDIKEIQKVFFQEALPEFSLSINLRETTVGISPSPIELCTRNIFSSISSLGVIGNCFSFSKNREVSGLYRFPIAIVG